MYDITYSNYDETIKDLDNVTRIIPSVAEIGLDA